MMKDNDLILIKGGNVSGALINSITRLMNTVLDIGRAFGSALRMAISGSRC